MKHSIIFRREGVYGAFPVLDHLPDGRLSVGFSISEFHDHHILGAWTVLVSEDEGDSWAEADDPSIPATWPGSNPREQSDRFAGVMPDGSWVCSGVIGHEAWPASRREEAESLGLATRDHEGIGDGFVVTRPTAFVQRSTDFGRTWNRDEWDVPGFSGLGFSRPAVLADGTVLVPVYGSRADGGKCMYVWRGTGGGSTWRLHDIGTPGNEAAFLETEPGRVLCLARTAEHESGGHLVQFWSDDGGENWSLALNTNVWTPGSPPHLVKLRDGRILLTHGFRRDPMGIRAVLSEDNGRTWDVDNTVVLRDDGGYPCELRPDGSPGSDVGYPHSTQLSDGSVLSVYYITPADGVTHVASTRWDP